MAGTLGRNLHLCFTKIKRPLEPQSPPTLLSPDHHSHPLILKNYNSLFDSCTFDSASKSPTHSSSSSSSSSSCSSSAPDFATVFASQRFFFSSPGRSNSIIESIPSSTATPTDSSDFLVGSMNNDKSDGRSSLESRNSAATVKDSVAVPTYSPDPYLDFRRSMQEMVEARDLVDVKANCDYLHELLSCYLELNPKSTHKFIVRAFADLLVSLLASQPKVSAEGG